MIKLVQGLLLIVLMGATAYAQDTLNYKWVNSKSLHYYYQKEWNPLLDIGKESIRSGLDFKYLRYRMGIAHYELGHYANALRHFRKVEQQSLTDTILQEYIYYSYLLGGRLSDARLYTEKMEPSVRERLGFKKFRIVDAIHLNVGTKISASPDSVGHMPFFIVGLTHKLGTRFTFYHHFSFLTQNYLGLRYNQYEYYAKAQLALSRGLQLTAAFHYTGVKGAQKQEFWTNMPPLEANKQLTEQGLVGLLGLQGDIGAVKWKAYGAFSHWQNSTSTTISAISPPPGMPPPPFADTTFSASQRTIAIQAGLELDYRLALSKKMWLSIGGHIAAQLKRGEGRPAIAPVWGGRLYWQANEKLGVGLRFLQANTTYYVAEDAFFTSNTIGTVNAQLGATLNYQVSPKLNWFFDYTYENRKTETFNFDYHILSTGIKFKL